MGLSSYHNSSKEYAVEYYLWFLASVFMPKAVNFQDYKFLKICKTHLKENLK